MFRIVGDLKARLKLTRNVWSSHGEYKNATLGLNCASYLSFLSYRAASTSRTWLVNGVSVWRYAPVVPITTFEPVRRSLSHRRFDDTLSCRDCTPATTCVLSNHPAPVPPSSRTVKFPCTSPARSRPSPGNADSFRAESLLIVGKRFTFCA